MLDEHLLHSLTAKLPASPKYSDYEAEIVPYLVDQWIYEYESGGAPNEIVQVYAGNFYYLFDVLSERLIAAWGVSAGKNHEPRPASRMANHPLSNGPLYHRGHAIPHTLGGGTDINLVPQLGSVNVGPFRSIEKRAVATPGSLYFSRWLYAAGDSQTPVSVEQGFLYPGVVPEICRHRN